MKIHIGFALAAWASVQPLNAQTYGPTSETMQARQTSARAVRYMPEQLALYRQELVAVWSIYHDIAVQFPDRRLRETCLRNLERATLLADEELAIWKAAGVEFGSLIDALLSVQLSLAPNPGSIGQAATPGLPSAPYSSRCGSVRPNTEDLWVALVAIQVGEGVWTLADRGCNEVIVVLGAGGNTSLLCVVADEALFLAKAIFDNQVFCDIDVDSAEIEGAYDRLGHIHGDLESAKSGIDSLGSAAAALQSSLNAHDANIDADLAAHDADIKGALAAHDANIDADVAAHDFRLVLHDQNLTMRADQIDMQLAHLLQTVQDASTLNVRMQIERNLSQPGSLQTNRVVLFGFPGSVGGHLETVRDIVQESLNRVQAAGLPLGPSAQYWFDQGQLAYALGNWKVAYDHYRWAYQAAAL